MQFSKKTKEGGGSVDTCTVIHEEESIRGVLVGGNNKQESLSSYNVFDHDEPNKWS